MKQSKKTLLPLILNISKKYNVPAELIYSIIERESGFDSQATNRSGGDGKRGGAYGLMQVTLATAKLFGFKGLPEELKMPATNIELGARILAECHFRAGNWQDAVAMYNSNRPYISAPSMTKAYTDKVIAGLERYKSQIEKRDFV